MTVACGDGSRHAPYRHTTEVHGLHLCSGGHFLMHTVGLCRQLCVIRRSEFQQSVQTFVRNLNRLIPALRGRCRLPLSPPLKRGCKRAAGAARLGGSDVGSSQAKPGRSDGVRYPVALICCRDGARVRRHPRGSTGEARRAWSGQDKAPAAVGHSAKRPRPSRVNATNPGHDGGAGPSPCKGISNHRRAMLRRCSLFDISGRSPAARCVSTLCRSGACTHRPPGVTERRC